ncbi:formylglycine-generating enzyme family protein [Pseudomonas sp. TTU2014-080ASC]|uniref:formylglycine-generating enzyme family protein n=1 Tax=Pseudomonas sp. TTU2014-080ASC TaxID=1729724 RepID=UPI00071850E9|nr:SUMF1/EgtB/PvdO family nonheme iron enzyme [Pseudomonas sp. TTU2014-080ASC]KRW61208.1 hypothetical protein AO726_07700 [Pseudomonas sp. TTU2014-080ASC]
MLKLSAFSTLLIPTLLLAACKAETQPPRDSYDQQLADKLPQASYETRQKVRELLGNTIANLVFIEGGTFIMGDWGSVGEDGIWRPYFPPAAEETKAHQVTLSNYSLGKYETTWDEYDTFLLATGRKIVYRASGTGGKYASTDSPREPYESSHESSYYIKKPAQDRWQDAKDYCLWLGEMTGQAFDLPTDAQYEYAARNRGQKWLYPTYNGQNVDYDNPYFDRLEQSTSPIGTQLPANPLGLFDIAENAKEWVNDWFSPTYYSENPAITDPKGPNEGTEKIVRSLGVGSLSFSFSRIGMPPVVEVLGAEHLVRNGFRCSVNSNAPVILDIPK